MVSRTVKDVFSKGFVSVLEDDTLSNCLSLFKEEMPPVLVVLDSKGKYKGARDGSQYQDLIHPRLKWRL